MKLFSVQSVTPTISDDEMPGASRRRVRCEDCGEEVDSSKEVRQSATVLCRDARPQHPTTGFFSNASKSAISATAVEE